MKKKDKMLLFALPSMIGTAVFLLIPLLDVFRRSFVQGAEFAFFDNYKTIMGNEAFRLAAGNTIKFEMVCLPLLLLISLLLAVVVYGMENRWIQFLFLVPLALPSNSIAVMWRLLFDSQGIVNGFLSKWEIAQPVDFLESHAAFFVLVGTYVWKNLGYCMLLWIAGLSAIPQNIYEAAKVDGAGSFVLFFKITMPNLRKSLYAVTVMSFVNSFKVFREAYLMAGNYPNDSIYLLQHVFNNWFQKLELGKLAAGSVVTALFLCTMLYAMKKLIIGKEEQTEPKKAVKKKMIQEKIMQEREEEAQ